MKKIFNTTDNIYSENAVLEAFTAGYNTGLRGPTDQVYAEFHAWKAKGEAKPMPHPTLKDILSCACAVTGMAPYDVLEDPSKRAEYAEVRRITCWFAWTYTNVTTTEIGKYLNYKTHVNVLHHVQKVRDFLETTKPYRLKVDAVKYLLTSKGIQLQMVHRATKFRETLETVEQ